MGLGKGCWGGGGGGGLQVRKLGWCDILSYCVNNLYFNTTEEVNINRQDTSHRIQEVSICAKLMSIYLSTYLSIHPSIFLVVKI